MIEKFAREIAGKTNLKQNHVLAVLELVEDGGTIPFIARYRKEKTGSMDETNIRSVVDLFDSIKNREDRRQTILEALKEQGVLTGELEKKVKGAETLKELEDLYLPYKKSRKTRADVAREQGLEPLVEKMFRFSRSERGLLESFINVPKGLKTVDDVLKGVNDIVAEDMAMNAEVREFVRQQVQKHSILVCKRAKGEDEKGIYRDYYEFSQKVKFIPSYRVLAIDRAEKEKVIRVSLELERANMHVIERILRLRTSLAYYDVLKDAVEDGYKRLLVPSIEREVRADIRELAQGRSIDVFSKNLRNILLTAPLKGKTVLALDPGYRTGCKCVVLSESGDFIKHFNIYPHQPQNKKSDAEKLLADAVSKYKVNLIAIGNGTASRESEEFIANCLKNWKVKDLSYIIVSEAGASVYSASKTAVEEFPDLDVTVRGAISIGHRVQDPLAESVKIPPESIGVGMYQHDLNQKALKETLQREVESVVNFVGVDVNTASKHLLSYVSGLTLRTAGNIVNHRRETGGFKSRNEIKKVAGIGAKSYEQAAGFLRVPESKNPYDNTIVHPESYKVADHILNQLGFSPKDWVNKKQDVNYQLKRMDQQSLAQKLNIHPATLATVVAGLTQDYIDPRDSYPQPVLKSDLTKLEDLKPGHSLQGTVRNVVDFGAFVDVGVKVDGLLHKSLICQRGQEIYEVLNVGDIINVVVKDVDLHRQRISLDMDK